MPHCHESFIRGTTFGPVRPLDGSNASLVNPNHLTPLSSPLVEITVVSLHLNRPLLPPQHHLQHGFRLCLLQPQLAGKHGTSVLKSRFSSHWQSVSLQSTVAAFCHGQHLRAGQEESPQRQYGKFDGWGFMCHDLCLLKSVLIAAQSNQSKGRRISRLALIFNYSAGLCV